LSALSLYGFQEHGYELFCRHKASDVGDNRFVHRAGVDRRDPAHIPNQYFGQTDDTRARLRAVLIRALQRKMTAGQHFVNQLGVLLALGLYIAILDYPRKFISMFLCSDSPQSEHEVIVLTVLSIIRVKLDFRQLQHVHASRAGSTTKIVEIVRHTEPVSIN
jgi:hypothetical protein